MSKVFWLGLARRIYLATGAADMRNGFDGLCESGGRSELHDELRL